MNTLFIEKCYIKLLTIPRAHTRTSRFARVIITHTHISLEPTHGFTFVTDRPAVSTVSFAPTSAPQQVPTQLERVTHAASEVAYAAGQVTYAGLVLVTQPPDVDNLSTCRHPGCLHFLR